MNNRGNIAGGVILISLGLIFLFGLGNFWPLFLIGFGAFLLYKSHITSSFILLTIGGLLLYSELTDSNIMGKFWPLILVAIGLSLILKNFMGDGKFFGPGDNSSEVEMNVFMSEGSRRVTSKDFKRAKVDVFMGSAKLDLSKATIAKGGATVEISAGLAEVEIIAPRDVTVESNGSAILGSWKNYAELDSKESAPVLNIIGSVFMGEVRVR